MVESRNNRTLVEALARAPAAVVDARDSRGRTPLFWAAERGYPACAEALLAAGPSPVLEDTLGRPPVAAAAAVGGLAERTAAVIGAALERRA